MLVLIFFLLSFSRGDAEGSCSSSLEAFRFSVSGSLSNWGKLIGGVTIQSSEDTGEPT